MQPFDAKPLSDGDEQLLAALLDGMEAGLCAFDRDGVIELMLGCTLESMEEVDVDEIVGRWAHADDDEIAGRVHWFVVARRD